MAEIINFHEAKAAMLRKSETPVARIFKNLEAGPKMDQIPIETLIMWAERINGASNETMRDIVRDIEAELDKAATNG